MGDTGGHNYLGHNYLGHKHLGHNYLGELLMRWEIPAHHHAAHPQPGALEVPAVALSIDSQLGSVTVHAPCNFTVRADGGELAARQLCIRVYDDCGNDMGQSYIGQSYI